MRYHLWAVAGAALLATSAAFAQSGTTNSAPATPSATPMTGNSTMGTTGGNSNMSGSMQGASHPMTTHHVHHMIHHHVIHHRHASTTANSSDKPPSQGGDSGVGTVKPH